MAHNLQLLALPGEVIVPATANYAAYYACWIAPGYVGWIVDFELSEFDLRYIVGVTATHPGGDLSRMFRPGGIYDYDNDVGRIGASDLVQAIACMYDLAKQIPPTGATTEVTDEAHTLRTHTSAGENLE